VQIVEEEEELVPEEIQELINLDEGIQLYEDNPNWENDVLLPPADPEEVPEVEEDSEEVQPPPSLREIQRAWNHFKDLVQRSSTELLSTLPDVDYALRKEIQGNGPSSLQTSISSYFQPVPSLDT
jgi:hypothetical protein